MNINTTTSSGSALDRFRTLVMADEALALTLSQTDDAERFVELAAGAAGAHGIALAADAVRAEIQPDPLGLARYAATPESRSARLPKHWLPKRWPPRHWLPIHVTALNGQLFVDWAHFGAKPLTHPFFEDSIRRALGRPFNRMLRYRMTIGDVLDHAAGARSLAPRGFIFHMSRCGSTLAAQMLAALPHSVVISEAAPIDAIVQLSRAWPDLSADRHRDYLIAMMAAYGRRRSGHERHFIVKLDSWHTLALPLFARAFPSVPWVFLYRDPVEVLVSQMRQRGTQMVPGIVSPRLYGFDDFDGMPDEQYCARVLNKICAAAVESFGEGGGLLVNYRELPDAIWTKILPYFGMTASDGEREIMRLAARFDAKTPAFEFFNDSEAKQREASELIRALAERHLGGVYRRLEALRSGDEPR